LVKFRRLIATLSPSLNLPPPLSELEIQRELTGLAAKNRPLCSGPSFLGAGSYHHFIPAIVKALISRGEFLTAYTPYQPEIAQGTLQVIFEYQTFIAQLTGQDIANASMYDGATSAAEAALMAMRVTKRDKVVLGNALHPHYRDTVTTYVNNQHGASLADGKPDDKTACVIIQTPDFHGTPHGLADWRKMCDETGALLVVVVNEIVSLGLLPAPVEADIVCGEAQSVGVAMSYGGPHLGFFATKEKFLRQMPGRLCGMTLDADGKRGFVLTLNTREQHIRREKATSNICTNQGLMALAFTVHMALLGEGGFKQLATLNHERACDLADALAKVPGVKVENKSFFNEFVIDLGKPSKTIVQKLADKGIIAGFALEGNKLLVTATEMTTDEHIEIFTKALKEVL
jgi:glycine dehydrogenase subunit 1